MSATETTSRGSNNSTEKLTYDVFVSDPPPHNNGLLPNGEPRGGSPVASTLIYGSEDAVLTDPPMTADQARALGDWVAGKGRNLIDIFVTRGHGDHWFAAGFWQSGSGPASSPRRARSRRCTPTQRCDRSSGTSCTGASRQHRSPRSRWRTTASRSRGAIS
jgi:metallo-beta-lactamase superfamily protein